MAPIFVEQNEGSGKMSRCLGERRAQRVCGVKINLQEMSKANYGAACAAGWPQTTQAVAAGARLPVRLTFALSGPDEIFAAWQAKWGGER
jgi:hypothetical protein